LSCEDNAADIFWATTRGPELLKTTRYFREQVLRKRPYLREEWIQSVLDAPVRRQAQPDGRIRFWAKVADLDCRYLRVVTLEDGETVHNAFPDRGFSIGDAQQDER